VQDAGAQMGGGDGLSGLASLLRVRPELDDLCRFGGSWASPHDGVASGWAYFHIVIQGCATVDRPGRDSLSLRAGDVLLLPHGDPHVIRASRAAGPAGRAQARTTTTCASA